MPTDEERRKVARRLRKQAEKLGPNMDAHEFANYTADVLDVDLRMSWYEMELRLAELIEPEPERTCEDVATEYGKFECSYCGCKITDTRCVDNGFVHFCPDCGRSVENAY